eukprot:scaffold578_cov167-Amphora_coffeaeformis.AAC.33
MYGFGFSCYQRHSFDVLIGSGKDGRVGIVRESHVFDMSVAQTAIVGPFDKYNGVAGSGIHGNDSGSPTVGN